MKKILDNKLSLAAIAVFTASAFTLGATAVLLDVLDILMTLPLALSVTGLAYAGETMDRALDRGEEVAKDITKIFG